MKVGADSTLKFPVGSAARRVVTIIIPHIITTSTYISLISYHNLSGSVLMARGQLMLLSQRTITELFRSDSNHPRLRRHHACVDIIQDYCRDASITKISTSHSYSVPPTIFKKNCLHYNTNVLFLPNDLPISSVGLWRIFVGGPAQNS